MNTFPYTRYDYTGAETYSPIGFSFNDPSQLKVILADVNGTPRTLEHGIDYTVSGNSVTLSPGRDWGIMPEKVFILKDTPAFDSPSFTNGVYLDVKKVQTALEAMNAQINELKVTTGNSVKFSLQEWHDVDEDDPFTIPPKEKRVGRILAFDENGNALMVLTTDIDQKLDQALAAENAAINAKDEALQAKSDAEGYALRSELAKSEAVRAEASANTLLSSIEEKTQASIESIESKRDSSLNAVQSETSASVARITTERDGAVTAIGNARVASVQALEDQKEEIVNDAKIQMNNEKTIAVQDISSAGASSLSDISSHRSAALSDISSMGRSVIGSVQSAGSDVLGSIESLASQKKTEIDSLTSTVKASVTEEGTVQKNRLSEEAGTQIASIQEEGSNQVAAVQSVYTDDLNALTSALTSALNETQKELATQTTINETQKREIANLTAFANGKLYNEVPKSGSEISITGDGAMVAPYAQIDLFKGKTRSTKNLVNISSTVDGYQLPIPLPKGTYTISMETDANSIGVRFNGRSSETVANVGYSLYQGRHYVTIEASFDVVSINVSAGGSSYVRDIQLEAGDAPTAYEPYFSGLKTAKLREVESRGKNLLKLSDTVQSVGGITYTPQKDGRILVVGTRTSSASVIVSQGLTYLKKGSYKLVVDNATGSGIFTNNFIVGDVSVLSNMQLSSRTFDTEGGYVYFDLKGSSNGAIYNGLLSIMIVSASVSDETYEPYRDPISVTLPPIVLRSAGSVHDTYEPSTGEVVKNVGEVDLGAFAWTKAVSGSYNMFYSNIDVISAKEVASSEIANSISPFVPNSQANVNSGNKEGISIGPDSNRIRICSSIHANMTGTEFKSAMTGVMLHYELANPTEDTVDPISPFISVEDGGTVSVISDDAQAEMDITYLTQLGGNA